MQKKILRKIVRELRTRCTDSELAQMSERIVERILELEEYKRARTVFAYMDLPGEVRTRALIMQCLKDGKRAAVPRIEDLTKRAAFRLAETDTGAVSRLAETGKGAAFRTTETDKPERWMRFYEISNFGHLSPGAMHILEPDPVYCPCIDSEEDALVIMPGVAYDHDLHRVGYGGGFYDRYLQLHRQHITVACAFDFQVFDEVAHEETDIRPQILVTPQGIKRR